MGGGCHSNVPGVCTKEGGPIGSPLTLLPPHSNLSRATQVQVKEREDPVNPDSQENIEMLQLKLKLIKNKTLSVRNEHSIHYL